MFETAKLIVSTAIKLPFAVLWDIIPVGKIGDDSNVSKVMQHYNSQRKDADFRKMLGVYLEKGIGKKNMRHKFNINRYNILPGQIYIAADGSRCGHLVTDAESQMHRDVVITTPFVGQCWKEPGNEIDSFKLAMVRYYLVNEMPHWGPVV